MRIRGRRAWLLCAAISVLSVDLAAAASLLRVHPRPSAVEAAAAGAVAPLNTVPPLPTTTVPPAPAAQLGAPPAAPPEPTTTTVPVAVTRPAAWSLAPYAGLGVWLDVYDWTSEFTKGSPRVQVADIDRMADLGIQTLYIQTAHRRSASDVIEPERLLPMIERAHARGMAVVGWYLPMLENTDVDLRRLLAAAALPIDGLGVDIESLAVGDVTERNRRLLELSAGLRRNMGNKAISAITPDAVHLQVVNPSFWPAFPWPELGATYNVIVPMAYWSIRKPEWKWGEKYAGENIDRIRAATGRPDMPIHIAGGIADGVTLDDLAGMVRAIQSHAVLGGSLYDWNTSNPAQWDVLRALRIG